MSHLPWNLEGSGTSQCFPMPDVSSGEPLQDLEKYGDSDQIKVVLSSNKLSSSKLVSIIVGSSSIN